MGRFSAFLIGGAIGAAASLLLSPRKGEENRALIKEKINESPIPEPAKEKASQFIQAATTTSSKVFTKVADSAQEAYQSVSSRSGKIIPASPELFAEKNDDLREKIDAARARIATQVAKNAEAVHGSAGSAKQLVDGQAATDVQSQVAPAVASDAANTTPATSAEGATADASAKADKADKADKPSKSGKTDKHEKSSSKKK